MKLTAILAMFISMYASADCVSDFRALQKKQKVKLARERVIEITSQRQLKFLIPPELKAVQNYMAFREFSFDGDNGLAITTDQYRERSTEKDLGYRISITDGGEHSFVKYYLKTAPTLSILYRIWDGETRVSEFLCK